jgi:GTP-binding protein
MTSPSIDPLVIKSVEFIGGMASPGGWRPPAGLPEVAFSGRSNVGKSSVLNRLVRRKKMARVSNTPGRTREINFFTVNDQFVLADLPGYGYARVSKEAKALWRPLIESYLSGDGPLRGVVQLLDVRHGPTGDDRQMLDYLSTLGIPTMVVFTKIDKLSPRPRKARIEELAAELDLDPLQVLATSSETGEGRDELAAAVVDLISQPSWRSAE